jgi:hypothetical protein
MLSLTARSYLASCSRALPNHRRLAAVVMTSRLSSSDNLLGHSPMAPQKLPTNNNNNQIPTALDVSTSGGVWAPSSAKREKLKELKTELLPPDGYAFQYPDESSEQQQQPPPQKTLDDLATPDELLDLYFADGLRAVMTHVDERVYNDRDSELLDAVATVIMQRGELYVSRVLTQVQLEEYLNNTSKEIQSRLDTMDQASLKYIRDFYISAEQPLSNEDLPTDTTTAQIQAHAANAIVRQRLLLTKAAADHLKNSWKLLTTVSDQDIDRAAVHGESLERQAGALQLSKLQTVLLAFLKGSGPVRLDAMWHLMDKDDDGLLDQVEMGHACDLAVEPVRLSLGRFFAEASDAHPARAPLLLLDESTAAPSATSSSWNQRRLETKVKKQLSKLFQNTLKNHMLDEIEMPHRLRCIYAWSNKAHQDNKVDSVLVDESGWGGRQRYVELHPKISLHEFRQVQSEHFRQIDRAHVEFVNSFREGLWIAQGKNRQRKELRRDSALFMMILCGVDFVIGTL